jgi:hypothetical protein
MTALEKTIDRWEQAAVSKTPLLYLSENGCAICNEASFQCNRCILEDLGICTLLNTAAVRALEVGNLEQFRYYANLIVDALKELE